jgi:acyl-CoA synthetase (AMP-forming)/AMP-acid ligase II
MITTVADILPHAARKHADRTALIVEKRCFSFCELDALSNRIANGLVAIVLQPLLARNHNLITRGASELDAVPLISVWLCLRLRGTVASIRCPPNGRA